jgi:hypothetical protein
LESKAGTSVTVSSTEAEYFGLSEVAKEVIYVKNLLDTIVNNLLDTIGFNIEYPIFIKVDNVGANNLAHNYTTAGKRLKHWYLHTFCERYIEDGIIKLIFVNSEDNDSDILTNNPT